MGLQVGVPLENVDGVVRVPVEGDHLREGVGHVQLECGGDCVGVTWWQGFYLFSQFDSARVSGLTISLILLTPIIYYVGLGKGDKMDYKPSNNCLCFVPATHK